MQAEPAGSPPPAANREAPLPVPPDVAAELLRLVLPALNARVRADGAPLSGRTIAFLHALHSAAERPIPAPTAGSGSEDPHPATVELTVDQAAALLECQPRWVRQLIADRRIRARRAGARLWLVDADSLDAYRRGTHA